MATPVACGWAGAICEAGAVRPKTPKTGKKVKCDQPTD